MKLIALSAALLMPAMSCMAADDSPRLQVTVSKKTIVRPASRGVLGDERGRVQTLVLSVVNQSIRSLPEGSVWWTAVVRKGASGSYKYSGTGKLPPLISFRSAELQLGAFEVDASQTGTTVQRDKIDYEVIISHNGKETYRTTSVSNFAALAAAAQPMGAQEEGPAGEAAKIEGVSPPKPPEPVPADGEKMSPPKPTLPVAEVTKPPGEPAPAEPPIPQQPFDFFNLGGKKPPAAK
jgi:hypothetical protein